MITRNFFSNTDDDMPLPDWVNNPGATPPPKPEPEPEPEDDLPLPDWLSGSAAPKATWDEADLKGWSPEMIQRDAEKRSYKDEIPELEDIPEDMPLPDLEDLTRSTGASGDDTFVPDWFMGLEEQNLDAAPDWVKSSGQIKDPSSLLDISGLEPPKPPSRLEQPKSAVAPTPQFEDEVPDWFSAKDDVAFEEEDEIDYAADVLADLDLDEEEEIDYASDVLADLDLDEEDLAEPGFDFGKPAMSFEAPSLDFGDFKPPSRTQMPPPPSKPAEPAADLSWLDEIESGIAADKEPAMEESLGFDFVEPKRATADFTFDVEAQAELEGDFFGEAEPAEAGDFDFGALGDEFDFGTTQEESELDFSGMAQADFEFETPAPTSEFAKRERGLEDLLGELPQDFGGDEAMPWMQHLQGEAPTLEPEASSSEFNFDIGTIDEDDVIGLFPDEEFADTFDEDKPYKPMTAPLGGTSNLISQAKTSSIDLGSLLDDLGELPDVPARPTPTPMPASSSLSEDELFGDMGDSFFESFNKAKGTAALEEGGPRLDIGDADFDLGSLPTEDDIAMGQVKPDWIADLRPEDVPIKLKAGSVEFELQQAKITDMSDELRKLREKSAKITAGFQAPQSQTPTSGPLAGIAGGLTAADLMQSVTPTELQFANEVRIPNEQVARIKLLESALEGIRHEQAARREGKTAANALPEIQKVRLRPRYKVDRLLVSLLLLAFLIVPFITDSAHLDFLNTPSEGEPSANQLVVSSAVGSIESGEYVLVAFDYDATTAHELNPLAEAVVADIVKQGGIPMFTSTSPIGILNARTVADNLGLVSGETYIPLHYIPGEAVGVRTLVRSDIFSNLLFGVDAEGEETNLELDTLDSTDFAFVVVIGAGFEDARRWAEQFTLPDMPKYLLTTAAAEPLAQTYVGKTNGYQGYLAGYRDTMRYNTSRNPERLTTAENLDDYDLPDTDTAQWYSTSMGVLVAVGLLVLGFVFNLLLRGRKRK